MKIQTVVHNGNKEITVNVTHASEWQYNDLSRIYFNLENTNKRQPISKLYQVIRGTTKDKVISLNGRNFAFSFGVDCNSNEKRDSAEDGVLELIKQICEIPESEYDQIGKEG